MPEVLSEKWLLCAIATFTKRQASAKLRSQRTQRGVKEDSQASFQHRTRITIFMNIFQKFKCKNMSQSFPVLTEPATHAALSAEST